jgi:hypothetical protein
MRPSAARFSILQRYSESPYFINRTYSRAILQSRRESDQRDEAHSRAVSSHPSIRCRAVFICPNAIL